MFSFMPTCHQATNGWMKIYTFYQKHHGHWIHLESVARGRQFSLLLKSTEVTLYKGRIGLGNCTLAVLDTPNLSGSRTKCLWTIGTLKLHYLALSQRLRLDGFERAGQTFSSGINVRFFQAWSQFWNLAESLVGLVLIKCRKALLSSFRLFERMYGEFSYFPTYWGTYHCVNAARPVQSCPRRRLFLPKYFFSFQQLDGQKSICVQALYFFS